MVKISDASSENEIHRVDSPFNEDSKIYFFCQGGPNFGGEMAGKFKENGQNKGNQLLCKVVVNSNREYWTLLPGIKVFTLLLFSCMLDQIIC